MEGSLDIDLFSMPEDNLVGRLVGPYKVLHRVGDGGIGAVYLAERSDEQFRKQVALKVIKRGMDSEVILRRFRSERQILASLNHPHIARLFDGGVTEDGRPYFVMEYVEGGLPIDQYCDQHRLDVTDRLKLFRAVCEAVHYAHQNLVVHRDLKPGNVLVSQRGRVKLLDFGIAKVLNPNLFALTVALTRTESRMMTPGYASPEQVRGEPITTASDVYSLGVMLYELLTGHRPYRFKTLTPMEIERVVCEQEPVRPSTVVGHEAKTKDGATLPPEQLSRARGAPVDKLRRRLSGDLDVIVLKALRKEPAQRYASVEQFGDDLERHLTGLPVTAQHVTVAYRVRKFVQRHRIGVAVVVAFVLLLSGYAVTVTVQAGQVRAALALAQQERDRAEREWSKSEEVTGFLIDLFEAADPNQALGQELTVTDLLERGTEQAQQHDADPEVRADLLNALGRVYRNRGEYERAHPLLVQALALRRQVFGEGHQNIAQSLNNLALVRRRLGDYEGAEPLLREAIEIYRAIYGDEDSRVVISQNNLAIVLRYKGDYAEAEALYRQTLDGYRTLYGPESRTVAVAMNNLGVLLRIVANYDEGEAVLRDALALRRRVLSQEHPLVALSMHNLGVMLRYKGEYAEAGRLLRDALVMRHRLLGEEHPRIAQNMDALGMLFYDQGDLDAAEPLLRDALAMRRTLLGEAHPNVALSMNNIGLLLYQRGAYAEAEALLRDALAMRQRLLGAAHPDAGESLLALATLFTDKGDYAAAELRYQEALAICQAHFADDHPLLQRVREGLARLYDVWSRPEQRAIGLG